VCRRACPGAPSAPLIHRPGANGLAQCGDNLVRLVRSLRELTSSGAKERMSMIAAPCSAALWVRVSCMRVRTNSRAAGPIGVDESRARSVGVDAPGWIDQHIHAAKTGASTTASTSSRAEYRLAGAGHGRRAARRPPFGGRPAPASPLRIAYRWRRALRR